MTDKVSGANTVAKKKPRGKPFTAQDAATRGKPFTGNDDPRNNRNGQRSAEVVRTAAQYRDKLVEIIHHQVSDPLPESPTYLEKIAYEHVRAAAKGDSDEREKLLDRIWGRTNQPIDLTSSDGSMTPTAVQIIPYVSPDSDSA